MRLNWVDIARFKIYSVKKEQHQHQNTAIHELRLGHSSEINQI